MKSKMLFLAMLLPFISFAQSASIIVTSVSQRTDGSGNVDIYFNLSGSGSSYNIALAVSFNAGSTYTAVPHGFLSGSVCNISPGNNKHIVWNGLGSFPNTFSNQTKLKLTATENGGGGTGQPCPGMPTFTDTRDGQTYNTVLIADQCWMKDNLKYLPSVVGSGTGSQMTPYHYVYGYNGINVNSAKATSNYQNYGVLYNWQASLTACPPGWHLPSITEWAQLVNYVVTQEFPNINETNGTGNALKSCRQVNSPIGGDCNTSLHPYWVQDSWSGLNHYGFDEFGFSLFPGGVYTNSGSFGYLGHYGYWWTSTEYLTPSALFIQLYCAYGHVINDYSSKAAGFSIRCTRDLDKE